MTILSPENRSLFIDAVRPPEGYRFDCGVGTTFSLNLVALLITPFSLALLDVKGIEEALKDPVILLESLQRYADRLTIFCQAGRIAIPPQHNPLYRYLEDMVVEVQAPRGGVFHPKVWVLRYVQAGQPPIYRFLCLSRNLTFDRSWDLMLRLDGPLTNRQRAFGRNNPLGTFIQTLPDLAINPVPARIRDQVDRLQHEVRRVDFQPPHPLHEKLAFHPSGIPHHFRGFRLPKHYNRALVISPFLSDRLLRRVTEKGTGHVLISRLDSLDSLQPATLQSFAQLYTFHEGALEEPADDSDDETGPEAPGYQASLQDLHAKLLIFDRGWQATWLIGSANATEAAFISDHHRNVEFMVEMEGKKSRVGIDKILGDETEEGLSLRSLLVPYQPPERPVETEQDALAAEKLADQVRDALIAANLHLDVRQSAPEGYTLTMQARDQSKLPDNENVDVRCWPATLPAQHRKFFPLGTGQIEFPDLSTLALTPFMAFEITATAGKARHTLRFVFNLPIHGLPEDRDDAVISAIVENQAKFLRFLRFILAEDTHLLADPSLWISRGQEDGAGPAFDQEMPLLEELMRALSQAPEKIDRINRLVDRLQRTPKGKEVLPEGFDRLWEAVLNARKEIHAT